MLNRSSKSNENLSSSTCVTAHPSRHLAPELLIRPIRMPATQGGFDNEANRVIGLEAHFQSLSKRFALQYLRYPIIHHFDLSRIQPPLHIFIIDRLLNASQLSALHS